MTTTHKYDLGFKVLDEAIGGVKAGTNIMLLGPPMCGKEYVFNTIMEQGVRDGEGVIVLATRSPGESILERFPSGEGIFIVDCLSKTLGINVNDTPQIKRASSPVDLTGIGVKISQYLEEFWMQKNVKDLRLCIDSLSTLLMYSNLQTIFRFMHVFSGKVTAIKALGLYVVDEGMHDDQTIATLKQLFNAVIEVKTEDDVGYLRVVGLTPKPTKWYEFEVVDDRAVIREGGK